LKELSEKNFDLTSYVASHAPEFILAWNSTTLFELEKYFVATCLWTDRRVQFIRGTKTISIIAVIYGVHWTMEVSAG
jgi:hypothetical protein